MLSMDPQTLNMEELGVVRAESELRKEVEELRRDVAALRFRTDNAAPREALLEERSSREMGEGAIRQVAAKLEETFSRESVALRADNADLRASLTEALKLLGEERRERTADIAQAAQRHKEFQAWSEEKTQRLESMARGADARASDNKQGVMEVERLRDLTEFRAISAVAEESRNREAGIQGEQQAREAMCSEIEARLRGVINEERQLRIKSADEIMQHHRRLEEAVRCDREIVNQHHTEAMARIEETLRGIYEEGRRRQADVTDLGAQVEEVRDLIRVEARERKDDEVKAKRVAAIEVALEAFMDRCEGELSTLRQAAAELRAACQVESTVREESIARIHTLIDEEARARVESQAAEVAVRDQADRQLEQQLRAVSAEQRQARESGEGELEGKVAALQHEHNFEKAKTAAQARELAQALGQAREAITAETTARRQEVSLVVRGLDEVREGIVEIVSGREKAETRLQEQVTAIDKALREECVSREAVDRKSLSECTELQDGVQRVARTLHEMEVTFQNNLTEERRIREEALNREVVAREQGDVKLTTLIEQMVLEEATTRDKEARVVERRVVTLEQARTADVTDREEEKRTTGVRMNTLSDHLSEARAEMRKALQKCDDFAALRETLLAESTARQQEERSLEMAVKEQQVKIDQVQRNREQVERKLENKLAELCDRIDGEANARGVIDVKFTKQMSDFIAEHAALQKTELMRLEDIIARAEKGLQAQAYEERGLREKSFSALEQKALELREGIDEVRKWRVEQYNELVFELSKLEQMLTEEAKARQQQDQVLAGQVSRLNEEAAGETNSRKFAIGSMQEEFKDVLARLERERESVSTKEKERWRAIETLRDDLLAEIVKREASDGELRQGLDKEALTREEVLSGATRAWQKANAKTNEDWRSALRGDATLREEATLRLEQQIVELRTGMQEARSVAQQNEEEVRQLFKAASEKVQLEEVSRKTEDLLLSKAVDDVRNLLQAEQTERGTSDQHTADRFALVENQLRDEALVREEGERRSQKDILELQSRLQAEQVAREESDIKLEQTITAEIETREALLARESKQREDGDAITMDAWQRSLREEQSLRERDRKDLISRMQLMQNQQQEGQEDFMKTKRDVASDLARLQSLLKEEEESRQAQADNLGAAIDSIHQTMSLYGPQREDTLKKCMDAADQVRNLLNKEVVARTTKDEAFDDALRDVRQRLNDEVQSRETTVRGVEDAVLEERSLREDALIRERRASEEELNKAMLALRKTREEEARRMQERILEVSSAINEERDLRQEALRQERQKSLDAKEVLSRDQKGMEREFTKLSQQILKQNEADAQRTKEYDMLLNTLNEKCESVRSDFTAEVSRRQAQLQNFEQRMLESHNLLSTEVKERRDMGEDLKKALVEEATTRDTVLGTDRRARDAGDLQVANTLKAALRDEREARESETAMILKELNSVKTSLTSETGHREDERSQQSLQLQKLRTEMSELLNERKVDVVAMREAFNQVTDELKVVQRTRKEDMDRLDGTMSSMSSRVDGNARGARDHCVALEQSIHILQSELQQEVDERQAIASKLDAKISEERRLLETTISAGLKASEEAIHMSDEASRNRWNEEARKQKALLDQLELQIQNLMGDLEKGRSTGSDQARELARAIAALQGALSAEEQARQQSAWQLQQGVDAVREEIAAEGKERRTQSSSLKDDIDNVQRLFQQRDERTDATAQKLTAETNDLRDRLARELRQREAAVSQLEQRLLSFQAVKDGPSGVAATVMLAEKAQPPAAAQEGPGGSQWREFQRQTDEDLQKQKRQIEGLLGEHQAIGKSIGNLSERVDTLKTGLSKVEVACGEVQAKTRIVGDLELQVRVTREDLANEAKERRAEDDRMRGAQAEITERFESSEQKRMTVESDLRQEIMESKNTLKKESRERELSVAKVASSLREETQKREEAIEREERARQEAQQRTSDSFASALRDERRQREKETLKLESRTPSGYPLKPNLPGDSGPGGGEVAALQMENRNMRQALGELTDRLSQTEMRQKSAEERTVSMLDTIMSGLMSPDN